MNSPWFEAFHALDNISDRCFPAIFTIKTCWWTHNWSGCSSEASTGNPGRCWTRIQYLKTQISIIFLFLKHDLDYIVAVQGAPYQSYRNWVERVRSIISLHLQSVGLMRQPMVEKYEKVMASIKSLADMRECARKDPGCGEAFADSLLP